MKRRLSIEVECEDATCGGCSLHGVGVRHDMCELFEVERKVHPHIARYLRCQPCLEAEKLTDVDYNEGFEDGRKATPPPAVAPAAANTREPELEPHRAPCPPRCLPELPQRLPEVGVTGFRLLMFAPVPDRVSRKCALGGAACIEPPPPRSLCALGKLEDRLVASAWQLPAFRACTLLELPW